MIGRLRGTLAERGTDHVVIDVGGVGYVVHCSERTLSTMPEVGSGLVLHTELLVKEELLQLFGFQSQRERELHRLLVTVQGVGAKAALSIVTALGVEGAIRSILVEDSNAIRSAQGVGPKLAQRVVIELKEKAAMLMALGGEGRQDQQLVEGDPDAVAAGTEAPAMSSLPGAGAEAISALSNLGYQRVEAAKAVADAAKDGPDDGTADLIREALKRLAPR